jgi:hypothetical protein
MKSLDSGRSFQNVGSSEFRETSISRILMDPESTNLITISTGRGFDHPQVRIAQTTPHDFVRLRFVSTVIATGDPDNPPPSLPTPAPF